jgi:hypothetical protein
MAPLAHSCTRLLLVAPLVCGCSLCLPTDTARLLSSAEHRREAEGASVEEEADEAVPGVREDSADCCDEVVREEGPGLCRL